MVGRCLDDYLPVIAIDISVEERMKIARMAAGTLHKLHRAMHEMKEWRDDSVRLRSNIWRIRMALRADDEDANVNQRLDPLIAHQKAVISRLQRANDTLENELANLKGDIARVGVYENEFANERERLNDEILRLKRCDRTMEMMLADSISKLIVTVGELSEELVTASELLYRFKKKNKDLRARMDKWRAMLRERSGNGAEYRGRIVELKKLAGRLTMETGRLKVIREKANGAEDIRHAFAPAERLINGLRNRLRNDRVATMVAGDPDRWRYIKRVVDLKVNLRVLCVQLKRTSAWTHVEGSCEIIGHERYLRTATLLNGFLREIDVEIGKLKVRPTNGHCGIGGASVSRYTRTVVELESIVKKTAAVVCAMKRDPRRFTNVGDKLMESFEGLIERLCWKMADLEVADDRWCSRERIDSLEAEIVRLRLELAERNDRVSALNHECALVRSTLTKDRERKEELIESARRMQGELWETSRKYEHFERRATEARAATRREIDATRKKLRSLRDDKEALSGEMERMRDILAERDKEIANIVSGRDATEGTLRAEAVGLKEKLQITCGENARLKSIIEGMEGKQEGRELDERNSLATGSDADGRDNGEPWQDRARRLADELDSLKAQWNGREVGLNEANRRIERLQRSLDEALDDRARLRDEISNVKSNEQSLTRQLELRRNDDAETLRKLERATTENRQLQAEMKHVRAEEERLRAELAQLRSEKELLERSMVEANGECATLRHRINACNDERKNTDDARRRARAEAEDATAKVNSLMSENSRLAEQLNVLSLRSGEAEGQRVRVLLTEKKELATRINELDEESVCLRDQLNKAQTENEYFSMGLNKSRVENDKLRGKNALLQVTCDKRERDSATLTKERDEARVRLNEISSECRVLGNQLKFLRIKYEAARTAAAAFPRENSAGEWCLKGIDMRYPFPGDHGRVFADARELKQMLTYGAAVKLLQVRGRKYDGTELKVESETCTGHDDKAGIQHGPREDERNRVKSEKKALKLEPVNLTSESSVSAMELARVEDQSLDNQLLTRSSAHKLQLLNISCGKEIENYSDQPNRPIGTFQDNICSSLVHIDQLQVENTALKREVDVLRSSVSFNLRDAGKMRSSLDRATQEIQALKLELMNVRDEKASSGWCLQAVQVELSRLRCERAALKDELAASRKSNFDLRLKANHLRNSNEKLKGTKARLDDRLRDALRQVNEYRAPSDGLRANSRNNHEDDLEECRQGQSCDA